MQSIYVEQLQTEADGKLTGFRFTLHYSGAVAEISILPAEPRSLDLGVPEVARLEIHSLLDALEEAAASASNILLQPAPRK